MAMEISSSRPRGNACMGIAVWGFLISSDQWSNWHVGGGGGLACMCPIVQGKEASGGLWEHWPDVRVDVHGISRDEINAYLKQYDAALCVFIIVCESLLICPNSHGESETRIGTKCKGCRVLHLLSRAHWRSDMFLTLIKPYQHTQTRWQNTGVKSWKNWQ